MPATSSAPTPPSGIPNPYGTYWVRLTDQGVEFQVSVRDPRANKILAALAGKSLFLAALISSGFFAFLGALIVMLGLSALLHLSFERTLLHRVEVRPDGLTITPHIDQPDSRQFFDRHGISRRELDFDDGLTFRFGIYDIHATPAFANEREFEIFEVQFEQAIARIWHQENLNP
jgi:hypothetical protein